MSLPLEGVRIVALEQFGAGPFATLNLADLGAEVIKIEDPATGGDVSRGVPPYCTDDDSLYFQSWNRNKRSLTLDLRRPGGMAVLRDLVRTADVLFNNLRGDQPARLGLTYAALKDVNPRLVCCSLNGYGSAGPQAAAPGYDYLMQASAGFMSVTGDPDGPPAASGISFVDHAAGFAAAMAMLAALHAAQRTGEGRDIEVSLRDTAYSMLTYLAIWNLNRGFEPARYRGSAHQTLVPVQTCRTRDGHLTIFCGKEKFWRLLCEAFDDPALAEDPRFATFEARRRNRTQVVEAVERHFMRRTTAEWLARLEGRVPCAAVRSLSDALADPTLAAQGTIVDVEHPLFGRMRQVNTPVRMRAARETHRRAPALGEDTEAILRGDLHYPAERLAALREEGVIGWTGTTPAQEGTS